MSLYIDLIGQYLTEKRNANLLNKSSLAVKTLTQGVQIPKMTWGSFIDEKTQPEIEMAQRTYPDFKSSVPSILL